MKLFTFWKGKSETGHYPFIDLCIETMRKYSPVPVEVVTPDNVAEYIDVPSGVLELKWMATQCDFIRVQLVEKFGGLWVDADTIILHDLGFLFSILGDAENWFFGNQRFYQNWFFGARKGSLILREYLQLMYDKIKSGNVKNRGSLNFPILSNLLKSKRFYRLRIEQFDPLRGRLGEKRKSNLLQQAEADLSFINESVFSVPIFNSLDGHVFRNWSKDKLLNGNLGICSLFRRALNV